MMGKVFNPYLMCHRQPTYFLYLVTGYDKSDPIQCPFLKAGRETSLQVRPISTNDA